ncbi:MAG TPA: hypothetical protein VFS69_03490 [Sphingomicrobium sp.]|jgi:hypothetical protein|nr:hypothetical protein [Sphingomicrobium sp.]
MSKRIASLLFALAALPTAAVAAQPPPAEPEAAPADAPPEPDAKTKWEFATIGYVWAAGAWGETDVIGPAEPVDLDLPFGKVLDAFKFAFMGSAEAKRDRLIFLGDLTIIHLDANHGIGIRDPDFLEAELDSRTAEVTLVGGYRVADKGPVTLDLLAGGRMNFLKLTLQLDGPNREADGEIKHNWLDPLIGARLGVPLDGRWSAGFYGDIGGIITGSDITWQAAPTINYQLNRRMTLGGGWRYYKVKFDKGDFLYNVHQSGPIFTFRTVF